MMITLAHHWLVTYRGGERVLAEFRNLFPHAPIATLVLRRGRIPDWIVGRDVLSSPLQRLPLAWKFYKALLPLHPAAIARLRISRDCRLLLTSDAGMIKGLSMGPDTKQVCYCHSPPRYLWDMAEDYSGAGSDLNLVEKILFKAILPYARNFDRRSANQVDYFVANSQFVAARIKECYGRDSVVIYPPVAVEDFDFRRPPEDFFLLVGQLVPYKRVDIAVKAFSQMGRRLVVIGEGTELARLREIAGPTVKLIGSQPFAVVKEHFETCRGFIHPQVEDFGITSLEAQACGRPVIAYRAGGALETVIENGTGIFFDKQTSESLIDAINCFVEIHRDWAPVCRTNAEKFNRERFRNEMKAFLIKFFPDILKEYNWPVTMC